MKKYKTEKKTLEQSLSLPPELPSSGQSLVTLSNPSSPLRSDLSLDRDLKNCRRSIAKWSESRGANQLSVRALIESIESAQQKQKLCSSHSSSNSSLNSLNASSPEFILKRENSSSRVGPSIGCDVKDGIDCVHNSVCVTPLSPTSKQIEGILTNKIDSLRRNSYWYKKEFNSYSH